MPLQRWIKKTGTVENGVFLGAILAFVFQGPYEYSKVSTVISCLVNLHWESSWEPLLLSQCFSYIYAIKAAVLAN